MREETVDWAQQKSLMVLVRCTQSQAGTSHTRSQDVLPQVSARIGWRTVRGETRPADVFHVFVEQNHRQGSRATSSLITQQPLLEYRRLHTVRCNTTHVGDAGQPHGAVAFFMSPDAVDCARRCSSSSSQNHSTSPSERPASACQRVIHWNNIKCLARDWIVG